jgi:hypothetical protein
MLVHYTSLRSPKTHDPDGMPGYGRSPDRRPRIL